MINSVIFQGKIVTEFKNEDVGNYKKTSFSLAVRRPFKKKNASEYESDYFLVEAWGSNADFLNKHFNKTDYISLQGEMRSNRYEVDGVVKYSTWLEVDKIRFVDTNEKKSITSNQE